MLLLHLPVIFEYHAGRTLAVTFFSKKKAFFSSDRFTFHGIPSGTMQSPDS
jgi:hypothetical protein